MKRLKLVALAFIAGLFSPLLLSLQPAHADFYSNRLMDDAIFDNVHSMSASQINNFLNNFPQSCISPNSSFEARVPSGYSPSGGFTYGNFTSAGQVIATAAQVYGINPQVLLVTLEKEQSLVTGRSSSTYCGSSEHKYAAAMGYGCPDSGGSFSYNGVSLYRRAGVERTSTGNTCVNSASKAGFSQQVIRAAWLLKFGQQRSQGNVGWAVITGSWDNSDDPQSCYSGPMTRGTWKKCPNGPAVFYDGYKTIDGTPVQMETGTTAALYWYTPHFHGNQNFVKLFEQTFGFGSTRNPFFAAQYHSQSPYPVINSGAGRTIFFQFKNIGNSFWKDDASTFPGYRPVHMASTFPINRGSWFRANNWINHARPTGLFSKVFEADGTTLAPEQHTVQPGQIARFEFTAYANPALPPGVYREHFQPILEGAPNYGWNMAGWAYLDIGVHRPTYKAGFSSQSAYPTVAQGGSATVSFKLKNTGQDPWFDDTSLPAGIHPVHLATSWPINRNSAFGSTWSNTARPSRNFSAVYEANGSTPSSNQHVVQPGQIAEFSFSITVPASTPPGFYREYFEPIVEGAPGYSWNMGQSVWMGINVTD